MGSAQLISEKGLTPQSRADICKNRNIIQDSVTALKDGISNGYLMDVDCPVVHRFSPGCYLREIFMPAGTMVIGKIHSTEHFNIILSGKVIVITAEGREDITAPHTFISKAGVQKCVLVQEDCTWQTVHVTNKIDLEEIEKDVISDDYESLDFDGLLHITGEIS